MSLDITKLIFRQGTDAQRQAGGGVLFNSGEPAYCIDTKRMFIGDSTKPGGVPVSVRNLGAVQQLFGSYLGSGFSQEAYTVLQLSGCEPGDLIYDRDTRLLYALTGKNTFFPAPGNFISYDFTTAVDPAYFTFNAQDQITIINECILPSNVAASLAAPGGGLNKPTVAGGLQISTNGVINDMLDLIPGFSVKGNSINVAANAQDIFCGPGQFIGRTTTSNLTGLDFATLLADASFYGVNGAQVNTAGTTTNVGLSTSHFNVTNTKIDLKRNTTISGSLSAVNGITTTDTVNTGPLNSGNINCGAITTSSNDINAGTGTLTCGNINGRTTNIGSFTLTCGGITCTTINTQNNNINAGTGDISCDQINSGNIACGTITTSNNTINAGTGGLTCGDITCSSINAGAGNIQTTGTISCATLHSTGDVIAFYTSDERLKENLTRIKDPLTKIKLLKGYEFTWKQNTETTRKGDDTGVIAQEVINVIPTAVHKSENGYLSVDYTRIIPLLVEGINALQEEIVLLKNEIQQLRK